MFQFFLRLNNIKYCLFGILFFLSTLPVIFLDHPCTGEEIKKICWGLLCFIAARSTGMIINQIIDRDLDGENPRTFSRPIPSGEISLPSAWLLFMISMTAFAGCSLILGIQSFVYSLIMIGLTVLYPFIKRFSVTCHFTLGSIYILAVMNIFSVLKNIPISLESLILGTAIGSVIIANDIGYSLYDVDFDKKKGLYSIASRFSEKIFFCTIIALYLLSLSSLGFIGTLVGVTYPYYILLLLPLISVVFHCYRLYRFFYQRESKEDLLFKGNFTVALSFVIMEAVYFFYHRVCIS